MALNFKFAAFDPFKPRKRPVHELKWKLPEAHMLAAVKDAEETVAKVKRAGALFKGGGQFMDVVHAKEFGEGVFGYFIVRTDKKTENESLLFEGYMLQEDEKLGVDLAVGPEVMENLQNLGYQQALARDLTEWKFQSLSFSATVYDISGFGAFIDVVLPSVKVEREREKHEKLAYAFFEKIGIPKAEIIPTDVITLQLVTTMQQAQGETEGKEDEPKQLTGSRTGGKFGGEFRLGD
ncbi:MAG: hypothetical protein WC792_01160 [Candidatus Micrarchaeia archaeon]|jgi:adenylate cyclase class IV